MHGVIFAELRKYVDTKLGRDVWDDLLKEAGLGGVISGHPELPGRGSGSHCHGYSETEGPVHTRHP
jgi:hypothetical protein